MMSHDAADYRWLLRGRFAPHQVVVRWVESTRLVLPEVETLIESAWQRVLARPGVNLFDGAVARFESFEREGDRLTLRISPSRYRLVVGTNFEHPELHARFGDAVMARPVGVSAGVVSADGHLLMGRRNASVAYYPNRVHPFAGSLEVRDEVDIFNDVRRELREELSLDDRDIRSIELVGIAEDQKLLHPETIFLVRSTLDRATIASRLDAEEHSELVTVHADSDGAELTPIARAVVEADSLVARPPRP